METPPNGGVECIWCQKKMRLLMNILLYLGNDTRYGDSYYEIRIGNCTQAFQLYQEQGNVHTSVSL